ncbi:DUF3047 domain-containing protein [Grimontia sp. NTOU-MAR1]|uniref:DUF3047 domain-containing protein n=1 Tax=Grimontia marina TaxID=646534 RepID=A0A128F141_9GAMM|nr:DUF3047 domain-containing protein [Grimontia sp. NTOU-MAR1]WRW00646.1 DUF3047 domain-containing protein [Grimontia sp. NTOU-MAR1]CZF80528.1 hypothetical protein GMA8713_01459 [Grimontia marina]
MHRWTYTLLPSLFVLHFSIEAKEMLDFRDLSEWRAKVFKNETIYRLIDDESIDKQVLHGQSQDAASALIMEKEIDLTETPWLSWQWKVDTFPTTDNEKLKAQDDFVWRISVTVVPGMTMMSSKTVVYVWTPNQPQNSFWPNPFAPKRFKMLAATSGDQKNQWVTVTRNVREDFKRLYGKDYKRLSIVAVTSDSDNSQSQTSAYITPLTFLEKL